MPPVPAPRRGSRRAGRVLGVARTGTTSAVPTAPGTTSAVPTAPGTAAPVPAGPAPTPGRAAARHVLVLQHAPWEGPGLIARALGAQPRTARLVLDEHDPDLPRARDLAGLVVMGGPMNADDDERYPGLAAERRLLAEAVDADVPVLGVCLGMQLLARALGATVHRAHGTEIGFAPVDVVTADPVLSPLGDRPQVLHWHGDAADLPTGATLLASTRRTPVQAFRAGSALGLQFHLEVDEELLRWWLTTPDMATDLALHRVDVGAQARRVLPGLVPAALEGLRAFAGAVAARG
ncbi:type 1 glutamine amidotransferase [Actinotalea ferrariae]|uniref:type 1 glutamine amidotransferase n=1 Tax=Actinotalea ferrariae TaxID=1386098 RepID=UPI001C8CC404|nr:type 1 glutamine amidotransferase [Actinotalea ferrariae]MBX9244879.1 type 1 glutamine amidotransferase [Actinotalea ferrariae]